MEQLLLHLWGDYILQSDWMAQNKTKNSLAALIHAASYSAGFLLLRPSLSAALVIFGTHFFIDRFRLARYVVWAKNWMGMPPRYFYMQWLRAGTTIPVRRWIEEGAELEGLPIEQSMAYPPQFLKTKRMPWEVCGETGYPLSRPAWLAVWLLIIADNILHLTINYAALRWLR